MSTATRTQYRLACPCGKSVVVDRSQAGLRVSCECGTSLEVPTIRGFSQLEVVPASGRPRGEWGTRQSVMFLGLSVAVIAFGWGGYRQWNAPVNPITDAIIREEIAETRAALDRSTLEQTWKMWEDLRKGLDPEEPMLVQVHRELTNRNNRFAWTMYAIGAAGLAIMAMGFFMIRR